MTPPLRQWETASHSDIGGREEQQDRVLVLEEDGSRLLVLADGMGGHSGGALAAETVMQAARARFPADEEDDPGEVLQEIVGIAHERMNAIGSARGLSPHSTCVLLYLTASTARWAHVGDSRLYRFEDGRLAMRTLDHSMVELMRLQGRISEEEMKTHADQNRLYMALGGSTTPEPESGASEISERDGFVLASDGLWEHVSTRELEEVFRAADLGGAVQRLVERAAQRGGPGCDNVSMAATRCRRARGLLGRLAARALPTVRRRRPRAG